MVGLWDVPPVNGGTTTREHPTIVMPMSALCCPICHLPVSEVLLCRTAFHLFILP